MNTSTRTNDPVVLPVSLRDYFAGQYLAGRAAHGDIESFEFVACAAYEMADAMLAERDK